MHCRPHRLTVRAEWLGLLLHRAARKSCLHRCEIERVEGRSPGGTMCSWPSFVGGSSRPWHWPVADPLWRHCFVVLPRNFCISCRGRNSCKHGLLWHRCNCERCKLNRTNKRSMDRPVLVFAAVSPRPDPGSILHRVAGLPTKMFSSKGRVEQAPLPSETERQ